MKQMNDVAGVIAAAVVICALILGGAYKYKYKEQHTIVVTGLGETEFVSDLIVWRGWIVADSKSITEGYAMLEESKNKVEEFITSKGVEAEDIVFMFVNNFKNTEAVYQDGNYVGQRFTGYTLRQQFTVESTNVEAVENISREISALLAQGVQIESSQPDYYYTKLNDLKLELIEQSTADAKARATKIANEAGTKLKKLKSARMGVFQITGANTNEEFAAGGSFNTSSKNKKAQVTMRLEYKIK